VVKLEIDLCGPIEGVRPPAKGVGGERGGRMGEGD
jgi:hypothetical protein